SHIDDTIAMGQLMLADRDYLEAMTATGPRRDAMIRSAAAHYELAEQRFAVTMLKYFVEDRVIDKVYPIDPATGKPRTRLTIEQIPPSDYVPTLMAAIRETVRLYSDPRTGEILSGDMFEEERAEYMRYVEHCSKR